MRLVVGSLFRQTARRLQEPMDAEEAFRPIRQHRSIGHRRMYHYHYQQQQQRNRPGNGRTGRAGCSAQTHRSSNSQTRNTRQSVEYRVSFFTSANKITPFQTNVYNSIFPIVRNPHLLVETTAFAAIGKLQPFLVSLSASALVVIDCHCSLVRCEVVGYLGGSWDTNTNSKNSISSRFFRRIILTVFYYFFTSIGHQRGVSVFKSIPWRPIEPNHRNTNRPIDGIGQFVANRMVSQPSVRSSYSDCQRYRHATR